MRSPSMLRAAAAVLVLVAARPAPGATRPRLVLRVENRSSADGVAPEIAHLLETALGKKGYEVLLAPEGTRESIADLTKRLNADAAIAVTISFYLGARQRARGPKASPAVGFSAELFQGKGERPAWHNSLGLIADEAPEAAGKPGTLDKDALKSLSVTACRRLLWTLPVPQGFTVLADEDDMPAGGKTAASSVPSYEVPLERLRALRQGPRFPLRVDRKRVSPPQP